MIAARLLLLLNSFLFGLFGILFLIWPATLAATVGVAAAHPAGIIDLRATYGGLQLGIAAFLATCALSIGGTAIGLLAATCTLGGLASGRLIGILANGGTEPQMYVFLCCETLAVVLNAWMLAKLRRLPEG